MPIEKRNVVEDGRTPGIKTAAAEERDPMEKAATAFSKKRVTGNGRQDQKERAREEKA